MSDCHIQIEDHQQDLPLRTAAITPLILAVLNGEQARADEVIIYFVDAEASGALHSEHFGDSTPTDCMSFPLDKPNELHCVLGEVVVCPKVAMEYIRKEGGDPYEEVALYVVHGVLHLLGYNDKAPDETLSMRRAEARYQKKIMDCASALKKDR